MHAQKRNVRIEKKYMGITYGALNMCKIFQKHSFLNSVISGLLFHCKAESYGAHIYSGKRFNSTIMLTF